MKKVVLIVILSIILLGLSIWAVILGQSRPDAIPSPTEGTQSVAYTVTFQVNGSLLQQQSVKEKQLPETVSKKIPGVRIVGWRDDQNCVVDPFAVPVTENVTYQAIFFPELTKHAPYLFADAAGKLRPDDALTYADLALALNALAAEGAMEYFPTLSTEASPVTRADLVKNLSCFYTDEQIGAAFSGDQAPTRSMFAVGMNQLLERATDEAFKLSEGYTLPTDITADRVDAAILLEASVEHEPAADGILWSSLELPTTYEPGFINLEGQLYYVQENRCFLKDGHVGTLYFGADGRYTSGDATLDATVVSLLKEMIAQNPEADRFALLRIAFDHCHQNYTYRRMLNHPAYGSTGWEIQRANTMFETTKGNCFGFAAIFWALSRGLGYETRAVSGKVLKDEQPHSWCVIQLEDGEDYIFDPQWQYNYTERGITKYDMFKIPKERFGFWRYQWTE